MNTCVCAMYVLTIFFNGQMLPRQEYSSKRTCEQGILTTRAGFPQSELSKLKLKCDPK